VPGYRPSPDRPEERGFVLIAAIWLLILAGSIASVLMLRSLAAATSAAGRSDTIERRLAAESAIETVIADRLFAGDRSFWLRTPAEGVVAIGDRRVNVRLSSESGRLDVNAADPARIDGALRGLGLAAGERGRIVGRLQRLRAANRRIGSLAELNGLVGAARGTGGTCLQEHLTFVTGLAEPRPDQMSRALSRALGGRGGAGTGPVASDGGAALRLEAAEQGGAPILAIVHVTGLGTQPIAASAWAAASPCAETVR
jgi:general secretion pathway protein K